MFFSQHKKGSIVLMTMLLITAYLGRFSGLDWLDDLSMVAIAVIGGLPLIVRAAGALRFKIISIELLVSIAVVSAIAIGEYSEAGIVVWLFSIGDYLEAVTLKKTRKSIQELVDLAPKTALKINQPHERVFTEVDIDEIEKGDYLLVKTGSQIPVDGRVVDGSGYADQASITGESKPSRKTIDSSVFAGTILTSGTLAVQAEKVGVQGGEGVQKALAHTGAQAVCIPGNEFHLVSSVVEAVLSSMRVRLSRRMVTLRLPLVMTTSSPPVMDRVVMVRQAQARANSVSVTDWAVPVSSSVTVPFSRLTPRSRVPHGRGETSSSLDGPIRYRERR